MHWRVFPYPPPCGRLCKSQLLHDGQFMRWTWIEQRSMFFFLTECEPSASCRQKNSIGHIEWKNNAGADQSHGKIKSFLKTQLGVIVKQQQHYNLTIIAGEQNESFGQIASLYWLKSFSPLNRTAVPITSPFPSLINLHSTPKLLWIKKKKEKKKICEVIIVLKSLTESKIHHSSCTIYLLVGHSVIVLL